MNPIPGKFDRDGETFEYEVHWTNEVWTAKVTDSNNQLVGTPKVALSGMLLSGAALEQLVRNWIESSIRDRAGVP